MMYRPLKIIFTITLLIALVIPQRVFSWQVKDNSTFQQEQEYGDATEDQVVEAPVPDRDAEQTEDAVNSDKEQNGPAFDQFKSPPPRWERAIPDGQWKKMINDPAFQYEETQETPPPVTGKGWTNFFMALFSFLASTAGKIIILLLVVLIVLFIVIRIVQLNGNIFFAKKDKKIGQGNVDEDADEFVPDDWDKAVLDAASSGNYRLAVRHAYRYLLSMLQEQEVIDFQMAKTNYQYAYELTGTNLHQPFMQLTRYYEYAWYGGFTITEQRFTDYYRQVTTIKQELNQKG